MEELKKFARYFKPYKYHIIAGILFILVSMAFGLLVPYYVGRAIDDLSQDVTWEKIIYYPLLILGINAVSGVFLFGSGGF
jgi:ABC-type multidrug transport system fused ATPase/permease subunit